MKNKLLENGYLNIIPNDNLIFFKFITDAKTNKSLFKLYCTQLQVDNILIFNVNFHTIKGDFNIKAKLLENQSIDEIEFYFYNIYSILKNILSNEENCKVS